MSDGRRTAQNRGAPTAEPPDLREGPPTRRRGLDPYELAILRGGQTSATDPQAEDDGPPPLPKLRIGNLRVGPFGLVVGLLVIIVLGSTVRYSDNNKPPKLAPSCEVPALALSSTTIPRGGAIRWTAVGPAEAVVLAIDVARLDADLRPTALAGAVDTQVVRPTVASTGCKATGVLGVQVPAGEHTVSVFPAAGGEPLASQALTVTSRR